MPVPVFGFSVGDFIAVGNLIWQLCQALDDSADDAKLFQDMQLELFALNSMIQQLQQSVEKNPVLSDEVADRIAKILNQVKTTTAEFHRHLDTFRLGMVSGNSPQRIVTFRKKVSWSFSGKKKIAPFRASIQAYSGTLTLILQALNSEAMQALESRITSGAKEITCQLQKGTQEIKQEVSRAIDSSWDQKPIRFQDAIGRRYPVPLEVCATYEGLLQFLEFAFKDSPITERIRAGSFWLFSPAPGKLKIWNLISESDWETHARPGMELGMSLASNKTCGHRLWEAVLKAESKSIVSFERPLPNWASYPEDAEFEFQRDPTLGHSKQQESFGPNDTCSEKSTYRCMRRWCVFTFGTPEELLDHFTPREIKDPSLGYGECSSCGGTAQDWSEIAIEIQNLSSGNRRGSASATASACAAALARSFCQRSTCPGRKAEWYIEYRREREQAKGRIKTAMLGLLPYGCPNDAICCRRFPSQQQLSAHLSENIADATGLAEIYTKRETDSTSSGAFDKVTHHCIKCHASTFSRYLDSHYVFKAGAKIQSSLNNSRNFRGLSTCVASYVVLSSIMFMNMCHHCSRDESPEDWCERLTFPGKPETQKRYLLESATKHGEGGGSGALRSIMILSKAYHEQGKWSESEELISKCVEERLKCLGLEHPDTLESMSMLASIYMHQERWKEAEELQYQVVQARIEALSEEHPLTSEGLGKLALCRRKTANPG